jgi:hypothetical protein
MKPVESLQHRIHVLEIQLGEVTESRAECREITQLALKERDAIDNRLKAANEAVASQRETIRALKRIIADNERQIADLTGYSRAQQERIEADSPIIEIPNLPTLATREQVRRNDELNRTSGRPYRETDHYGMVSTGREPKKHWTEI